MWLTSESAPWGVCLSELSMKTAQLHHGIFSCSVFEAMD